MDNETVEPKSLVGSHRLSGVDEINRVYERYGEFRDCQCINFVLDGVTYTAIENPDDGYRSSLDKIIISEDGVINTFEPIDVLVSYNESGRASYSSQSNIIEFRDIVNGKIVMSIGTDNTDDYYPVFIAEWMPENLSVNGDKQ